MCNPVVPLVAGTALSMYGQKRAYDQAKGDAARINSAADQNVALADEEYVNQLSDIRTAQAQIGVDAASEESDRVRAAREESATIAAIAGEYADGNNTTRLLNDSAQEAGQDIGRLQINRDRRLAEVSKDATAARISRDRQVAGINSQRVSAPSRGSLMLGLAGTGIGAYNSYLKTRPPKAG
jgi:hypothetical protein